MIRSHASMSAFITGVGSAMPAQFTKTSMPPHSADTAANAVSTSTASDTSVPRSRRCSTDAPRLSVSPTSATNCRSSSATRLPSRRAAAATAIPMPPAAPVTMNRRDCSGMCLLHKIQRLRKCADTIGRSDRTHTHCTHGIRQTDAVV